jgi:hypothetical protein
LPYHLYLGKEGSVFNDDTRALSTGIGDTRAGSDRLLRRSTEKLRVKILPLFLGRFFHLDRNVEIGLGWGL